MIKERGALAASRLGAYEGGLGRDLEQSLLLLVLVKALINLDGHVINLGGAHNNEKPVMS